MSKARSVSFRKLLAGDFKENEQLPNVSKGSLVSSSLVNIAVSVPCLFGYASIIYNDPIYNPYMSNLTKLVILSSAVHQIVFCIESSMWFSIGQVQDVGLIYLSHMSQIIANESQSAQEAVSTAVFLLAMSTALLGMVVIAVSKMKLANWVQSIPHAVVAGYLSYIGFFCFAAGLGLASNNKVSNVWDFTNLIFNSTARDWMLITPALVCGAAMALAARKQGAPWFALPVTIIATPLLFYWLVLLGGVGSMDDARKAGWMNPINETDSQPFYHIVSMIHLDLVNFSLVPKLATTWLSMCFVVTFASSLDILALDMECDPNEPKLDLNQELCTVGWSNLVSGMLGGYTGSYIVSVTSFMKTTELNTRLVGVILAMSELTLVLAPISLLSYVPRFFFAATLIFIAFDLIVEWLLASYFHMSRVEYGIVWFTFLCIALSNNSLVLGIVLGSLVSFASDYIVHERFAANGARRQMEEDGEVIHLHGFLHAPTLALVFHSVKQMLLRENNQEEEEEPLDSQLESSRLLNTSTTSATAPNNAAALIIDFSNVRGMDSAQTTAGLGRLRRLTKAAGTLLVFSGMSTIVQSRFENNGLLDNKDGGIVQCEDLESAKRITKQRRALQAVIALSRMRLMLRHRLEQQAGV